MRVARWTLLAASLAVAAYAKDARVEESAECVAPTAAAALEAKIGDLQQSNAVLQLQVDAHSADKTQLLADVAREHEAIVLKLQDEIAALKSDVETLEKDVKTQQQAVDKAETELKTAQAKLTAESQRVTERDTDVAKLEQQLAKQHNAAAESDAELEAALAKLHEEAAKTAQLEKSQRAAEQKQKALAKELSEAKSVELSMAALLSSYYDEALDLAEQTAVYAQQKLSEQSGTLEQVQGKMILP
jgi:chromosome segregation ATPase